MLKVLQIGLRSYLPSDDGGALAMKELAFALESKGIKHGFIGWETHKHSFNKELYPKDKFVQSFFLDTELRWSDALLELAKGKSYHLSRFKPNSEQIAELLVWVKEFNPDVIIYESLYALTVIQELKKAFPKLKHVYRSHNIEYVIWKDLAKGEEKGFKRWYLHKLASQLEKEEQILSSCADIIIPISAIDEQYYKDNCPNSTVLPLNALSVEVKEQNIKENKYRVYFIGSLDWQPNVEGLNWFIDNVMPLISGDFQLEVAGKGVSNLQHQIESAKGIHYGYVENAESFHLLGGVMISPLWSGSGVRLKILEAVKLGIPVLATEKAIEGLPLRHLTEVYIANNASEWAQALRDFKQNPEFWQQMGLRGQARIKELYSQEVYTNQLQRILSIIS